MLEKVLKGIRGAKGRDRQLLLNMGVSVLAKGMGILNAFILVPLYLAYLDKSSYGVWLAISSLLAWMRFFEFGLGNGLKNRLVKTLSKDDLRTSKEYVSTAYFFLFIIFAVICLAWLPLNSYIPWGNIFKTILIGKGETSMLTFIVVSAFLINIFLTLIQSILHAIQATRISDIIGFMNNLSILLGILILSRFDPGGGSLIKVAWIAAWFPVVGLLLSSVYLFYFSNISILRKISPDLSHVHIRHFNSLFGLGLKFFFIQVSMLVVSQSANLLILAHYNGDAVVDYHILNKYFSVSTMIMTLLLAPLWPAVTDAFQRGEYSWIRKRVQQFFYIFLFFSSIMILQFFAGDIVIGYWLGDVYSMDSTLALALLLNHILFIFGGNYNIILNAMSKLKLQTILIGLGAVLFYPLFILFKEFFGLGVESVVYAMIIAKFYIIIVAPIQYYRIVVLRK